MQKNAVDKSDNTDIREILGYIMSKFNNQELIIACIKYLPSIIESLKECQPGGSITNYVTGIVMIIEGQLYDLVFIKQYYTLRFFKEMSQKNFFDKEKDLNLLEKIAPLVVFPHNWIRNEAIGFIEVYI